ncbi:MAG: Arm DNA-binding domain-containing protein [Paracoccaceae bacterium]
MNHVSNDDPKKAGLGKYSDGGGLWLYKRKGGGAQWVCRYTLHSRRHEMGLGRYPDITLKEARETAEHWRGHGRSPIRQRETERLGAARNMNRLADISLDAFESRKAELKGDGKAGR